MKIPIHIEVDSIEYCSSYCPFFDFYKDGDVTCLLFKEQLEYKIISGVRSKYFRCRSCSLIMKED